MRNVGQWYNECISNLGLEKYKDRFETQGVDGELVVALSLEENLLLDINVDSTVDRLKFHNLIHGEGMPLTSFCNFYILEQNGVSWVVS